MGQRAKLIELHKRKTEYDKREDIYNNGEDNGYPMEIERVVFNSPTAKRSALMMSKALCGIGLDSGEGLTGSDDIVNKKKEFTASDIVKMIADDISIQYGAFIHVGYGVTVEGDGDNAKVKIKQTSLDVLDYNKCRISKEDVEGNKGVIKFDDYEKKSSLGKARADNEKRWYYPYNPNQKVVIAQIKKDAKKKAEEAKKKGKELSMGDMIAHYRGQVLYLNLTPRFKYAISLFDPVFNDCDTEYRMSVYSNGITREGFMGKTYVLESQSDEEEEDTLEEDLEGWLGSENAGGVYYRSYQNVEDVEKMFHVGQLESQYDDDQFSNLDERIFRNITGQANNIPEGLVRKSATFIGESGASYVQQKIFYEEQTEWERGRIRRVMKKLGFPVKIKTLTELETGGSGEGSGEDGGTSPEEQNAQAQATLRGSVGGVNGILAIQKSVTEKATTKESGIAVLKHVYGFSQEVAEEILGDPVPEGGETE